uniref:Uncharacterized protein n=1 Tax=Arundo donax TaxID=35708 RepID=A0A0A8YJA0_ARUDO
MRQCPSSEDKTPT